MPHTEYAMFERLQDIEPMNLQRYLWAGECLRPDNVVLDAACGCGHGTFLLSLRAAKVIGLDRSETAIAYAEAKYRTKRHADRMEFRVANLATENLGVAVYDVVVSLETIEHLTEADGLWFLASVHSALKPKGVLLLSSPAIKTPNPYHLHEYATDEMAETLRKGFDIASRRGQRQGCILAEGDDSRASFNLWVCRKQ